jgi:hypothetical protein
MMLLFCKKRRLSFDGVYCRRTIQALAMRASLLALATTSPVNTIDLSSLLARRCASFSRRCRRRIPTSIRPNNSCAIWTASDRQSIHEGIRRSVGFATLCRMVFGIMERWIEERLRGQAAASAAAGDESETIFCNATVAAILSLRGRHSFSPETQKHLQITFITKGCRIKNRTISSK